MIPIERDEYSDIPDLKTRITDRFSSVVDNIEINSDACLPKGHFRHFHNPLWDQNMKALHACICQARRLCLAEGLHSKNTENINELKPYFVLITENALQTIQLK